MGTNDTDFYTGMAGIALRSPYGSWTRRRTNANGKMLITKELHQQVVLFPIHLNDIIWRILVIKDNADIFGSGSPLLVESRTQSQRANGQ